MAENKLGKWAVARGIARPAPKADSALVGELREKAAMLLANAVPDADDDDRDLVEYSRARNAILAALSDRDVVLEEAGFDYVIPQGSTYDEWREHVRQTALYQRGDTVLVWVNQADLSPFRALKGGVDE